MGYGSAMRDITDGSAIEWTADPANRCGAEYNVIFNKKNSIEYIAYVCICTLCRDCTVLYIRVCIPDISKYGVCITDEYLHTRHRSRLSDPDRSFYTGCFAKAVEIAWTGNAHLPIYLFY